jgi:hypothetical protein
MKLRALGRYTNEPRRIDLHPGDEIEVDEQDPSGKLTAQADPDQKPFDKSPDGTTLPIDPLPAVITGSDTGVEVTHRADADEQAEVLKAQAEKEEDEDEKAERAKALKTPAQDKQVKAPARSK